MIKTNYTMSMRLERRTLPRVKTLFASSVILFVAALIAEGFWFGNNHYCYTSLGCNAGFFGFDALVHFSSGIAEASLIIWLAKNYKKVNFFDGNSCRNIVILVALVALLGIGWELLELGHDLIVTNTTVFSSLPFFGPENIAQPSGSDTMGDLSLDLLGALVFSLAL